MFLGSVSASNIEKVGVAWGHGYLFNILKCMARPHCSHVSGSKAKELGVESTNLQLYCHEEVLSCQLQTIFNMAVHNVITACNAHI